MAVADTVPLNEVVAGEALPTIRTPRVGRRQKIAEKICTLVLLAGLDEIERADEELAFVLNHRRPLSRRRVCANIRSTTARSLRPRRCWSLGNAAIAARRSSSRGGAATWPVRA